MTIRTESIRGSRAFAFIREKKHVHKFELMEFLGISISSYEKFKPWFEYNYGKNGGYGYVIYEKKIQEWIYSEIKDLEN